MNFLKLTPNQEYEVTFKEASLRKLERHWEVNVAHTCEGEGCHWCAKGYPLRVEFTTIVECEGQDFLLGIPEIAGDIITARFPVLQGARALISKHRRGQRWEWDIIPLEGGLGRPSTDPKAQDTARRLRIMADTLRVMAEEIDNLLLEGHL